MSSQSGNAGNLFQRSEEFRTQALEMHQQAKKLGSLGHHAAAKQEMKNAWDMLDEALRLCPSNHRARFLKASYAMSAEDYELARAEAIKIYTSLSREQVQGMHDSLLHLTICHACKMLGEKEEALRFAHEGTQLFPNDPQIYMICGELFDQVGESIRAEQACRQALLLHDKEGCTHKLSKENVYFTLSCIGSNLLQQGKYSDAEMFLIKAAHIDSSSSHAYDHLSEVYHCQGRHREALDAAKKAAESNPNDHSLQARVNAFQAALQDAEGRVVPESPRAPSLVQNKDQHVVQAPAARAGDYYDAIHNPASYDIEDKKSSGSKDWSDCSTTDSMRVPKGAQKKVPPPVQKQNGDALDSWFACCFDRM